MDTPTKCIHHYYLYWLTSKMLLQKSIHECTFLLVGLYAFVFVMMMIIMTILLCMLRNLGVELERDMVPHSSYFFMPHFPDRRGRQTQTLPKWINLQPFSYQSSIWFMRVSCLENSRSRVFDYLLISVPRFIHSRVPSGIKKSPSLNNFICFPPPMKEKICHLILRIGKKVRNKRKRKWCPFQNHSFEFMIFNGGNLVWKYLKSWAKCQDKQLYVFLSRKG